MLLDKPGHDAFHSHHYALASRKGGDPAATAAAAAAPRALKFRGAPGGARRIRCPSRNKVAPPKAIAAAAPGSGTSLYRMISRLLPLPAFRTSVAVVVFAEAWISIRSPRLSWASREKVVWSMPPGVMVPAKSPRSTPLM